MAQRSQRRRILTTLAGVAALALAGAGLFFYWPHPLEPVAATSAQPNGDALVARGRYLTIAADCAACHTTKDGKPFAGGLAFKLPFGTIYSSNITPDPTYGIGEWTDAEFARALRHGVGRRGENLYAAFPYTSYTLLSDDDVLAIRAYLATLAAVAEATPANDLAFPFNQRRLMRGWNLLFLRSERFVPDPARSAAWNRGAYLVRGLAHCGECHTPRNLLFASKVGEALSLSGGAVDGSKAWNLTTDKATGIAPWTDAELVSYLHSGYAPGHGAATGSMREAIDLSLSKLPASDLEDIVTYLRSLPPRAADPNAAVAALPATVRTSGPWSPAGDTVDGTGKRIFEAACASCHAWNGNGQQTQRAALAGAHALSDPEGANLVRVIVHGSSNPEQGVATAMPAFGTAYSDAEIAAVANYAIAHFGGKTGQVTPEQVARLRQ